MSNAKLTFSAEDRASSVINNITKQLGIFSKEGLSMGIAFAAINKGIQLVEQAIQGMIDYIQKGVEMNRQFELSLARLSVSTNDFDVSMDNLKNTLQNFSILFGEDLNVLAAGLRNFIREGNSAAESVKLLFQSEILAKVTGDDLATIQDTVTTSMEIFGLSANSASYIVKKLNQITSTTGLSLSEINNILGRSAITIHDNAINLDDVANAFFTLDNRGVKSRSMIAEFDKVMKDFGKTEIDVIQNTTDLNIKFEKITSTAQLTSERIASVNKIIQMNAGKGFDWGAGVDTAKWNNAIKIVEQLGNAGVTTTEQMKGVKDMIVPFDLGWGIWDTRALETIPDDLLAIVRAIMAENAAIDQSKIDEHAGAIERAAQDAENLKIKLQELNTSITNINASIATNKQNLSGMYEEQKKMEIIHTLNEDVRYMSMGLTDATYAAKIHNSATRDLVNSIRVQKDAIDELNIANQKYSISSNKINLEIMKIQYAAMGTRRGTTRAQEREIKRLEQADTALRISMMENQIAIDQKTLDLSPEQKKFEQLTTWYNEEVYIVQNSYALEYQALVNKIALEQTALEANLVNYASYITRRNAITAGQGYTAQTGSVFGSIFGATANAIRSGIARIPTRQFGGDIPQTGLYQLHKGEIVIPANKATATSNSVINIPITINNPVVRNKSDTIELAHTIKRAISQGLLTSTGQTTSRMR